MVDLSISKLELSSFQDKIGANTYRNLSNASVGTPYMIQEIKASDQDLIDFLFTLGCYEGEEITVISILAENFVINIKDARYSIDRELAEAIRI